MDTSDGWPLSIEELSKLRTSLASQLSFVKIVNKYGKGVEEIAAPTFTHKCICPNVDHKQGNERTPSFFFSEKDKSFWCFGCHIKGDIFDLIAKLTSSSPQLVIQDYANLKNANIDTILGSSSSITEFNLLDIKHDLCIALRDDLSARKSIATYNDDCKWVDSIFRRIDDRFETLTNADYQQAKYFTMQISMEFERRQNERQ